MPLTPSPCAQFWRDPAWPVVVETRRASGSRACYRPHSHPSVSIGGVDRGRSLFSRPGGAVHPLRAGSLVVVPAGVVHACNPAPGEAWSYQMLHLDARWWDRLRAECGLAPGGEDLLVHAGDNLGSEGGEDLLADGGGNVPADGKVPTLYRAFDALNTQLFAPDVALEDKEAALIDFLVGALWPAQGATRFDAPTAPRALEPLLRELADGEGPLPDLTELARRVGLSRFQLIRHFSRHTGLTPHAWLLNQRVGRSRDLLRGGAPLADLACRLGFADQSHFQRVFKAHVGVTPHRYRSGRA